MSVVHTIFRSARSTFLFSLGSVLVLVIGTVVGANFVTAGAAPGAGTVAVSFNYNGATSGDSVTSATFASGVSADAVLPSPTKSGFEFTGWFNNQSLLNGQRITTIANSDSGVLTAGYVPPELAQALNLLLPPPPACATGAECVLGDIGPGGGLVFLIDGATRYEMAPKTWSGGSQDPSGDWCTGTFGTPGTDVPGAVGIVVGTGKTNTAAMAASGACGSDAAAAVLAYGGNDGSVGQWFLPSKDELNAMCNYSRNPTRPPSPPTTGACFGAQNGTFAAGLYAFTSDGYWSSTQYNVGDSWYQNSLNGQANFNKKYISLPVRAVRSF